MQTTSRLRRSTAALALSGLVLTACGTVTADETSAGGQETGTDKTSADRTSAGPLEEGTATTQVDAGRVTEAPHQAEETTAADGNPVELEQDSVGGVPLPADPDTLLGELTARLGEPTEDEELPGCAGTDGGVLRTIAWGGLRVSGMAEDEELLQLTSWQVRAEAPEQIALPHDLSIGATQEEAMAALPDAQLIEEGAPHGGSMILSDELRVLLDSGDNRVLEVNAHSGSTSCD